MPKQVLEWWSLWDLYSRPIRKIRDNKWSKRVFGGWWRLHSNVETGGTAIIYSKYLILSNHGRWSLRICINISTIGINQPVIPLKLIRWLQGICAVVLNCVSTALTDEQQSCWTHALVCLFKSRQLQSYWLVLCSDHSNNQAAPHQKTLERASLTTETIWNTLWLLYAVLRFDLANDNNADILLSKAA